MEVEDLGSGSCRSDTTDCVQILPASSVIVDFLVWYRDVSTALLRARDCVELKDIPSNSLADWRSMRRSLPSIALLDGPSGVGPVGNDMMLPLNIKWW